MKEPKPIPAAKRPRIDELRKLLDTPGLTRDQCQFALSVITELLDLYTDKDGKLRHFAMLVLTREKGQLTAYDLLTSMLPKDANETFRYWLEREKH